MDIEKQDEWRWIIPKTGKMNVEGLVYANEEMMADIRKDQSLQQVVNVAALPGIRGRSMAMPDIHWGYGFPIGGVAGFDTSEGVVSPGGVGYDINWGVRLLRSGLSRKDIQQRAHELAEALLRNIPSGVGSRRKDLKLRRKELEQVLTDGVGWTLENGYGNADDLAHIESEGRIPHANPDKVSDRALDRGKAQLGTLGSGNHFVEVGYVKTIFDAEAASVMGLEQDQATVLIHTGSRGLGHQVCDDFLSVMLKASERYGIELPDRQLCCAPVDSPEGLDYMGAMAAAANFAFVNRQMIMHWTRETFAGIFEQSLDDIRMELIYDVCHNIAKIETHQIDGRETELCIHRKGATRAFPPGHPDIPETYRTIGQPVLVPGDMGRHSYVLTGTEAGYRETFGSACHGAGRMLSRRQAKKAAKGRNITRELEDRGIVVKAASRSGIIEEMSDAYKNVDNVVDTLHDAGICKKVAELAPIAVIKG